MSGNDHSKITQRSLFSESGLWALLMQEPRLPMLWATVLSLLNALATLAIVHDIQLILSQSEYHQGWQALRLLALLMLVMVSYLWAGAQISRLACRAMMRFRQQLAAAVVYSDFEHIEQLGLARINAAFTEDLPKLGVIFTSLPGLLLNGLLVLFSMLYLALISWPHFLLTLSLIVVAIWISERLLLRQLGRASGRFRSAMQQVLNRVHGLVYGKKELTMNEERAQRYLNESLHNDLQQLHDQTRQRDDYQNLYTAWSLSISLFIMAAVLLCAQWFLPMSLAVMSSYVILLLYLRGPVIFLINHVPHWINAQVALNSLGHLDLCAPAISEHGSTINTQAQNQAKSASVDGFNSWQRIDFVQLAYQYVPKQGAEDTHRFVLKPVSISIQRGETVFISGGNGRGKSTLLKLIAGLYTTQSGSIRLDGYALKPEDYATYRGLFATVLDGFYVFPDAFKVQSKESGSSVLSAALNQFDLPIQRIANDGELILQQWSQGQRKRLALITALAEDRDILLLDEWAAEQDPEFRRYFYTELIPEWKRAGKTIIAVTHDDQYFSAADRVFVLNDDGLQLHNDS